MQAHFMTSPSPTVSTTPTAPSPSSPIKCSMLYEEGEVWLEDGLDKEVYYDLDLSDLGWGENFISALDRNWEIERLMSIVTNFVATSGPLALAVLMQENVMASMLNVDDDGDQKMPDPANPVEKEC